MWKEPIKIITLDDVDLNKIDVKGKYIPKYDITDYAIKYNGSGFWLYINYLEGSFDFKDGIGCLEIIFKDMEQKELYNKIWDKIIDNKIIKDIKKIRLISDDLPLGYKFNINSIVIVIKAVVKNNNVYYPQISLNNCINEV